MVSLGVEPSPALEPIGTAQPQEPLDEPVLPDDYPIYGNYLYVADGKVVMSHLHDVTARQLKAYLGATELRRCDIYGRRKQMADGSASDRATGDAEPSTGRLGHK